MKVILFIALILFFKNVNCQFYLGLKENQVRIILKEKSNTNIIKKVDGIFPYLIFEFDKNSIAFLYFEDKTFEKSFSLKLLPANDIALKHIIEYYNKNYVITSPTSWRYYLKGIVYNILVDYDNETQQNSFYITEFSRN